MVARRVCSRRLAKGRDQWILNMKRGSLHTQLSPCPDNSHSFTESEGQLVREKAALRDSVASQVPSTVMKHTNLESDRRQFGYTFNDCVNLSKLHSLWPSVFLSVKWEHY